MRKITGLLLIIFSGNIMRIDCEDENMVTVTYEFISVKQFLPDNRFIEKTEDNSITWMADDDGSIFAYLGIPGLLELYDMDYICTKSAMGSENDEARDKLVTFFFAQGKPCPITKGTTSNLENRVFRTQKEQEDLMCDSQKGELLLFDYGQSLDIIITINLNITTSGCK